MNDIANSSVMSNDSVSAIEVVIPVESAIVNESKIESDKAEKITKNLSFYEKLKLRITSRPMMGTIFILFFLPFFFMGCILTIVMYMLYILIMSPRIILLCCFGVYINSDDFFCFELKVFELSVNIGLGLMFFFSLVSFVNCTRHSLHTNHVLYLFVFIHQTVP